MITYYYKISDTQVRFEMRRIGGPIEIAFDCDRDSAASYERQAKENPEEFLSNFRRN